MCYTAEKTVDRVSIASRSENCGFGRASARAVSVLLAACVCTALASCYTTPPTPVLAAAPVSLQAPSQAELRPGDEVEVLFPYWPELTTIQTIRGDGKIAPKSIAPVEAAGLLPEELAETLMVAYGDQINDPEITVVLRSRFGNRVYVGGAVQRPGLVRSEDALTVLEAVILAGGFTEASGEHGEVTVLRTQGDTRHSWAVPVGEALRQPESTPFYLQPNDVVYVPRAGGSGS